MKYILLFTLSLSLFADTTFITPLEYASQLYKNPRGIGCQHCHGDKGEGKLIAKYIHKGKHKEFRAPAINSLDLQTFFIQLNKRKKGMPRYFLTQKEIKALYFYISEKNSKKGKNSEK